MVTLAITLLLSRKLLYYHCYERKEHSYVRNAY